ncbi:MAG: hypothetical protein RLZZ21_2417 [Planctomycetota bacterium]|jgi:hypothetical protein
MMLELFAHELAAVERRLAHDPLVSLSEAMRRIPLEVFGELCLSVPDTLESIRSRLLRLMLKFAPADGLHGVDPWHRSIDLCREHGIPCRLALSDYVPRSLPYDGPFDLVYAFSVFTHLSESTARAALSTIRRSIAEDEWNPCDPLQVVVGLVPA